MTDEPVTVAASPGVAEALDYARDLLDTERDRTTRLDLQAHRLVTTSWPWFAIVQAALILAVTTTDSDEAGSGLYLLAIGSGVIAMLGFVVLVISAYHAGGVGDDDNAMPASLLDSLVIRSAGDPPIDQAAVMLEFNARRLADRRRANAARASAVSAMRGAWACTMVAAVAELALSIGVLVQTVSY